MIREGEGEVCAFGNRSNEKTNTPECDRQNGVETASPYDDRLQTSYCSSSVTIIGEMNVASFVALAMTEA